ncbi:MAG: pantoate--beta-alanine ligase [Candidatus Poribacteria bacterium]|nr:pantoate--beta-alanine ligase [Candidatus Poribacteria bacterium]
MKILTSPSETQTHCRARRAEGKQIGLVPTMGFLHEGHLSLVRGARTDSDFVVVSIFVNPTQFGPSEDFGSYPRDFEQDRRLLVVEGVDLIFAPTVEEMYPPGSVTAVEVAGQLTKGLCGASRPSHFYGVTTVVSKLFNIVSPHRAYFGQKDAQQLAVIQRMVADLNFDIEIVPMPTVRESDGLAMSSRNRYLSPEARRAATVLYRSLQLAKERIEDGERTSAKIIDAMRELIEREKPARIDYIELVDTNRLEPQELVHGEMLIALAVFVGQTRLIDNLRMRVPD